MSSFGHDRERQVRKVLEDEGWVVARCAGSLGDFDLFAAKAGTKPRLIEVKATAAGPYAGFLPADRERLREVAEQAGAVAELAFWPRRKKLEFIGEDRWP